MPEAVRLVAGEARAVGPDQVAADERGEIALKRGVRQLGSELAERAAVEQRALDGRPHEERALALGQALEPRGEQRVDRLRDAQVAEVAGDDPAAVVPHEALVVDEHREQLLGEQRVAVGEPGDPRLHRAGSGPPPSRFAISRRESSSLQRLERRRRRVALAAAPVGMDVEQLGSRHAEQEDRSVARVVREVVDEVDEGRLRPLEVVEDDDERARLRERLEELAHGPERLLAAGDACR